MRQSWTVAGGSRDLMAKIAVNAARRNALHLAQIEIGWIIEGHRRRMAGGADAGPIGIFSYEVPATPRLARPAAAVVEIEKMTSSRRGGMAAGGPFTVNLGMTMSAGLLRRGIGVR